MVPLHPECLEYLRNQIGEIVSDNFIQDYLEQIQQAM